MSSTPSVSSSTTGYSWPSSSYLYTLDLVAGGATVVTVAAAVASFFASAPLAGAGFTVASAALLYSIWSAHKIQSSALQREAGITTQEQVDGNLGSATTTSRSSEIPTPRNPTATAQATEVVAGLTNRRLGGAAQLKSDIERLTNLVESTRKDHLKIGQEVDNLKQEKKNLEQALVVLQKDFQQESTTYNNLTKESMELERKINEKKQTLEELNKKK